MILGFEFNSEDTNLSVCPKLSYGTQIFLSTAGTTIPIFLQPLAHCLSSVKVFYDTL